jgi:anti-anti-sigma regulatory factor
VVMAVREAAVNAVLHGNGYDPDKQISASFENTGKSLVITIADQGEGLDPDKIPDPLAPENLLRGTGRGIFLIRSFLDEVHFRQLHPGTELTLVKHLSPAESTESNSEFGYEITLPLRRDFRGTINRNPAVGRRNDSGPERAHHTRRGQCAVARRHSRPDQQGLKSILLSLGDVNYIDSSGLGELVSAFTTAKNQGADVKLLNLTKKVKDVLQVTKLYTVFDIYDDEASAIASFK